LKWYCTLIGKVEDGSKGRKLTRRRRRRRGKDEKQVWSDSLIAD
jgi:hypothetical protein